MGTSDDLDAIRRELDRIYGFDAPRWDERGLADFSAEGRAMWEGFPEELRVVATYVGREDGFPHEQVQMLYGPYDLIEWNSSEGTFGQLREHEGYPYGDIVKFGDDAFLDPTGQIGPVGAVYLAIGNDLDGAERLADGLLSLLRQAGSYRDDG